MSKVRGIKVLLSFTFIVLVALAVYTVAATYFEVIRPRSQFEGMLKSSANSDELRAWGLEVLGTVRSNGAYGKLSCPVHPALAGLYAHFKPEVYAFEATSDNSEYLMVSYAAGHFGSWGIEIGQTNRPTPIGSGGRHYKPWAKGICFFYGPG